MFNAPRPAQRYTGTSSTSGFGGSFVDENPLASSVYDDGLDPWSAAPSPSATPIPHSTSSVFSSEHTADATVPAIYNTSFAAVDPSGTGETSVNSLSRVLATSALPAATIDKIVNLVSSRPRVSNLEFFVALALMALAQAGKDVSIEQVAALSSQNTLPEPTLDLSRLQTSTSAFAPPINYRRDSVQTVRAPAPAYSSDDPWNTTPRYGPVTENSFEASRGGVLNGAPSSLAGTGLPKEWWRKQEVVKVNLLGPQGVRRLYREDIQSLRSFGIAYTEDTPSDYSQPYLPREWEDDGLLAVFLTEPSFEIWRKNNPVSLDEESVSKRVDRIEEMTIPSDLEDKLAIVRGKLNPLIEQWQRICILAERIVKRQEAAAVRSPPAFRRAYLPTHFSFAPFSVSSSPSLHSSAPIASTHSIPSSLFTDSSSGFYDNPTTQQGDLARLTNTLRAVIEVNEHCWRGDECELSNGVRMGLEQVALHTQRHSDLSESRTRTLFDTTLEGIKVR
ncbi:hypothetical protein H0H81_000492 [Sphagnurus paluster]|uniref:Uncharacterized protein n=1 Tax=Sphagnurus paluster TaxID=117069 RepID=A0A9P7FXW0_9AGAR|nr:hypothetical protein H0H81_000492 [Sphagnurus paluster]